MEDSSIFTLTCNKCGKETELQTCASGAAWAECECGNEYYWR